MAGGGVTEKDQELIDHLNSVFKINVGAGLKPLAKSDAPLEKRTATINSVTADHNVIVNGQKGVTLHINLDIVHCKGVDCKCGAWLYYANGNPVKDTNNQYRTVDGQVAASVPFKPGYDDTHYGDLQLFFPYDEFHIEGKNVSCYLSLQIYCSDTGEFISNFYKNNMTYSSGDKKTVEFKRIWLEDLGSSLNVHIHFQVNHALNQNGKIIVWFNHKYGDKVQGRPGVFVTTDGQACVSVDITPNYEYCEWEDLRLTIPYSAMALSPNKTYKLKLQAGVVFGSEQLPYSNFMEFNLEVTKKMLSSVIHYRLV